MKIFGKFSLIIQILLIAIIYISCTKKTDLEQYGQISGKVKDAVTGEPILGAVVTLSPINSSTTTGGDGAFSFVELQSRQYSIQVMKDGFQTTSTTVEVVSGMNQVGDILISNAQPILKVSTTLLDYGSDKLILPLEIQNEGIGQLTWNITSDKSWISANITTGSSTTNVNTVNISIDRNHLGKSTYVGTVVVSSNGGSATINVTVNVNGPLLNVTPIDLEFGTNINILPFEIRNIGNGTLNWNVVENTSWFSVNTLSGNALSEVDAINVTVDRTGLSQGPYSQSISITSDGGAQIITVNLLIADPNSPTLTCANAINISQSTAEVLGNISNIGSSNIIQRGHCWSTSPNPTISNFKTTLGSTTSTGSFTSDLTNLSPNTTYYVKAYASNNAGTGYSSEVSFTTTSNLTAPTVTTGLITSITITDAIAGGNITNAGTGNITQYGHCWSLNMNPTVNDNKTQFGNGVVGSFSSNLAGLSGNSTYYVRAYATNGAGTSYGSQQSFSTLQASLPSLTTSEASNITGNSAVSGGTISNNGGALVTYRGICWSIASNPTTSNSFVSSGFGNGSFISNLSGLNPSTTYFVRAYATNSIGTAYGNQITFNTITPLTVGQNFGGGIIFYIDGTGQHGLIAAPSDQSAAAKWGCNGVSISGADGIEIGTGLQNTLDIIAGCPESGIAARLCYNLVLNGFDDWYLPSKYELNHMYEVLHAQGLGGFVTSAYYWSSSEENAYNAYDQKFVQGGQFYHGKSNNNHVRAIRSF